MLCPVCSNPAMMGITHPGCRTRYSMDGLTTVFMYKGPIKAAVKELKYRYVRDIVTTIIDLIPHGYITHLKRMYDGRDPVLVPIPLHEERLRHRGFNQALQLARKFSTRLCVVVADDVLIRTRQVQPQAEIRTRAMRKRNIRGVFAVSEDWHLVPDAVVLLDDVYTSGATMNEASKTLKRAGVRWVWGVTIAR